MALYNINKIISIIPLSKLSSILDFLSRNPIWNYFINKNQKKSLGKLKKLDSVLIIADLNIGDAVLVQPFIEGIKYYFPKISISFVYTKRAKSIIENNPNLTKNYPIFQGSYNPKDSDYANIKKLIAQNHYDLIINFCPSFNKKNLSYSEQNMLSPVKLANKIISTYKNPNKKSHLKHHLIEYLNSIILDLPKNIGSQKKLYTKKTTQLFLKKSDFLEGDKYLESIGIDKNSNIVFFNPDASSKYTFINKDLQIELITKIIASPKIDHLILGSGFKFKNIEKELIASVPKQFKSKIKILPKTLLISIFTAILDRCNIVITGDTAPLHIASARKKISNPKNKNTICINKTKVTGIFGASPDKIYGYDSTSKEHIPSSQDASSKIFKSNPNCKSMLCILYKVNNACEGKNCFKGLDLNQIIHYINNENI
ncbi:glycosyltransferase family 9 protein [bacterium]